MKILKVYVRNHYKPEGYIIEGYIIEEGVDFCFEFLANAQTIQIPRGSKRELMVDRDSK